MKFFLLVLTKSEFLLRLQIDEFHQYLQHIWTSKLAIVILKILTIQAPSTTSHSLINLGDVGLLKRNRLYFPLCWCNSNIFGEHSIIPVPFDATQIVSKYEVVTVASESVHANILDDSMSIEFFMESYKRHNNTAAQSSIRGIDITLIGATLVFAAIIFMHYYEKRNRWLQHMRGWTHRKKMNLKITHFNVTRNWNIFKANNWIYYTFPFYSDWVWHRIIPWHLNEP